MTCSTVNLGGIRAIVCTRSQRKPKFCPCGVIATRACDWKGGKKRRCSFPLCDECTVSPAKDKDLCPKHAKAWAAHPSNPANKK